MAISDYKITTNDISGKTVKGRATILNGEVSSNQQVFDDYPDVIRTKYNGLVDYLTDNPPATTDEVYPIGSIIAKSTHSSPSFAGTWVEMTGITLTLTISGNESTMYFYQRIA